ncbi:Methylmalonyl-CoA carboxyltransferase 5S subunit [Vibrio aerogenes CECT 7868]|uniref:Methylmalonyl-CoA carboxyltransferase 5S subunit n=1 Tax=Vibrio aerogenes CECT 7868 TaxID=1216006 RepID=A0A1M5YED3_9VIBR|nr:Methylmalonyl-CoA carboxyltransferase 5S subunit [Vibrio aerogenes CECT 7868]
MSNSLALTDVVLRDAHQSLFATRMRIDDMLPIASALDDVGYWSLETWGVRPLMHAFVFSEKIPGSD